MEGIALNSVQVVKGCILAIFFRFARWVEQERCSQRSCQRSSTSFLHLGSTKGNRKSRTYISTSKLKGYCRKLYGLTYFHRGLEKAREIELGSNLFSFCFMQLHLAALTLSIQRRKGQISCMSSHVPQRSASQNVRLVSFL